jgi:hypothetical protein
MSIERGFRGEFELRSEGVIFSLDFGIGEKLRLDLIEGDGH